MFKILIYLYIYIFMKKVYKEKSILFYISYVFMKMGSSDNITGVIYADIGGDNHDDPSFYLRNE